MKKNRLIVLLLTASVFLLTSCEVISGALLDESIRDWREHLANHLESEYPEYDVYLDLGYKTETVSVVEVYAKAQVGFMAPAEQVDVNMLINEAETAARSADETFPGKYETKFEVCATDGYEDSLVHWKIIFKRRCKSIFSMQ